ncbi:hypothetical protein MOC61_12890 [Bacillus inaquosorum]|uniref:hypothetical protein n=1 Tax=Bacillus inaquosorum TaxID=483913 RepID=UPI00228094B3|nr:hypothetical protein [Bacillus inaquosorum]MCY7759722.1 hypothetical protein [Bacillus inaquosorum]MCY7767091.1 hypothetical protein [Bacillus inaquosorum]MCY7943826.1 hypothetical protein [Bacillus inaquosorum]MCY8169510.1 hypothetical protein [Bacillus inaquosorum]MCY8359145.1 hypothetical protein [Bacillus inaquosorum]
MDYSKQLEEKYPLKIIQYLRQREGLKENDVSMDKEILNMTEAEVFRNVLSWNGFVGWDHLIKDWIKSIYAIDLDEFKK